MANSWYNVFFPSFWREWLWKRANKVPPSAITYHQWDWTHPHLWLIGLTASKPGSQLPCKENISYRISASMAFKSFKHFWSLQTSEQGKGGLRFKHKTLIGGLWRWRGATWPFQCAIQKRHKDHWHVQILNDSRWLKDSLLIVSAIFCRFFWIFC